MVAMPESDPRHMNSRVGAVIVNFNAGAHLTDCVTALRAEGVEDIVVVDNGSSDDSLERATSAIGGIKVEHLPNPGYGAAANHGAKLIDNEVLFVINPDARVFPGAIKTMLERFDQDPDIAMVGPALSNDDGSIYPSARMFPSFVDGVGHAIVGLFTQENRWSRRYKMADWGHSSFREVDWISGAALFIRRKAFDSVSGFDDGYWMFMEDVDLSWRLSRLGWKIVYEPGAQVAHTGGVSTSSTNRPMVFVRAHHKSLVRYHRRTATGTKVLTLPLIVVGIRLRFVLAWVKARLANR